jgi:hypothetical protein
MVSHWQYCDVLLKSISQVVFKPDSRQTRTLAYIDKGHSMEDVVHGESTVSQGDEGRKLRSDCPALATGITSPKLGKLSMRLAYLQRRHGSGQTCTKGTSNERKPTAEV